VTRGRAVYIEHEDALRYRFSDTHPFNQFRLVLTRDLLRAAGALEDGAVFRPDPVEDEWLLAVHTAEYVDAVRKLSQPLVLSDAYRLADRHGLGPGDTPFFPDMHAVTSRIAGGSVAAAELVMSGRVDHALHLAGGLHHAMPDRGSGFCVYNDAAVAIAYIRRRYGARVLYVDTDVHHGDGVQFIFYADPDVCTLSIHESGRYLFPGTGFVHERGEGNAFGTAVNLPLEPYTGDESWLEVFREAVVRTARAFRPDCIVSQHGCDAHAFDPLAHLLCSMQTYAEIPHILHRLAHEYCGGRWIALGGGGYDIWRVVPRAWSLLWLEMTDHPLAAEIRGKPDVALPDEWLRRWADRSPVRLPAAWLDRPEEIPDTPRKNAIADANRRTADVALQYMA